MTPDNLLPKSSLVQEALLKTTHLLMPAERTDLESTPTDLRHTQTFTLLFYSTLVTAPVVCQMHPTQEARAQAPGESQLENNKVPEFTGWCKRCVAVSCRISSTSTGQAGLVPGSLHAQVPICTAWATSVGPELVF